MAQLRITGSLTCGPAIVTDNTFPAGSSTTEFTSTPSPKPSAVDTGLPTRQVNSPSSYTTLTGVGDTDTVTKADTLYLRTVSPMLVRLTFAQTGGPDLASEVPVHGLLLVEVPTAQYLKLVEVKGAGAVEYLASGQQ